LGLKYYICPSCGEITIGKKILENIEMGGMGLCGCEYVKMVWNSEIKDFDPDYYKCYSEWVEISKKIMIRLSNVENHVIRLEMFRTIPERDLLCL
jgi:hypothetical protein